MNTLNTNLSKSHKYPILIMKLFGRDISLRLTANILKIKSSKFTIKMLLIFFIVLFILFISQNFYLKKEKCFFNITPPVFPVQLQPDPIKEKERIVMSEESVTNIKEIKQIKRRVAAEEVAAKIKKNERIVTQVAVEDNVTIKVKENVRIVTQVAAEENVTINVKENEKIVNAEKNVTKIKDNERTVTSEENVTIKVKENERKVTAEENVTKIKEIPDSENFKLQEVIDGIKQDDPRLINYIKENHLTPPKSRDIPYNLNDNKYAVIGGPDSSHGEIVTKEVLKVLGNYTNGLFIEGGADDGEFGSNSLLLERDYNWTGVLIEPQPISLEMLYKNNRHSWISNVCISPFNSPSKTEFNTILDLQIDSRLVLDKKNYKGKNYKGTNKKNSKFITVQCFPIFSILAALGWNKIDFFSLDVESFEFDVLKTIPWEKIQFKVLTVEVHQNPVVKEAIKVFLKSKGYIYIKTIFLEDFLFGHESLEYFNKKSQ